MNSKYLKSLSRWIRSGILFLLFVLNPLGLIAADAPTNAPPSTATAANATNAVNTWLTFGLERVEWLQVSLLGNPLWQYLAALIYTVLAFPSQTLYLKQDSEWHVASPENRAARN